VNKNQENNEIEASTYQMNYEKDNEEDREEEPLNHEPTSYNLENEKDLRSEVIRLEFKHDENEVKILPEFIVNEQNNILDLKELVKEQEEEIELYIEDFIELETYEEEKFIEYQSKNNNELL
jgi:hypothetical protein